jgi:hypothetical protein
MEKDRDLFRKLLLKRPFLERWLAVLFEQLRMYRAGEAPHGKLLPDYCYNIFAIYRRTYFRVVPILKDTVSVTDKERLAGCQSIEEAKQVVKIDWRNLGKTAGYLTRGIRFFDLEVDKFVEGCGLSNLSPEEQNEVTKMLFGDYFCQRIKNFIKSQTIGTKTGKIRKFLMELFGMTGPLPDLAPLAYQWSPEAMAEFNAGMAEGMAGLFDEKGQLAGESNRANIYNFLLLAWPEIKEMQESSPRKTLTDLYHWMKPFMRLGVLSDIDLDTFRDVCAPPTQHGIGLQLRPLSSRS